MQSGKGRTAPFPERYLRRRDRGQNHATDHLWRAAALAFRIRCEGLYGVRKKVLVVAQQIELRARIARVLHSAGYGAELAGNQKRALELAVRNDIQAAIVVHSTDLAGLGQKLRRKIPTTIVVGHRTDEIVRPGNSLQGIDAFPEDAWMNRSCSIGSANQRRRQGASAM